MTIKKRGTRRNIRGGDEADVADEADEADVADVADSDSSDDEADSYDNEAPSSPSAQADATYNIGGRHHRRMRRRSKSGMRGGESAASNAMKVVGSGQDQWRNVFDNPQTHAASTGNGLWSTDLSKNVAGVKPIDHSLGKLMQGGKKPSRKTRKGGNFIDIIGQAVVPFGLLGMQQAYSRRKNGYGKSKKQMKKGGKKSKRHRNRR